MLIGVPKEIKNHEYRVALTPAGVQELCAHKHEVLIQKGAGDHAGFSDADFEQAGAQMVEEASELFARAQLIVKVKEPQSDEIKMLRPGQILFAYLHLAPDPEQTKALLASGASCVAFETVTDDFHALPLLTPMSEVAGRMAVQEGAYWLESVRGGSGVLLGGVPGVAPANVLIIGGGVVGSNAAQVAVGMGAQVTIVDRSLRRLRQLDELYGPKIVTQYSTEAVIEHHLQSADLVIGAVLIPGATAPKLVSRAMLKGMRPGSVMVDVAIDQGGCFETSRATSHDSPTFIVDRIIHYCVANMPGAVARTSTVALANATLPFVAALADKGLQGAMAADPHLCNGLNIHQGKVTEPNVASALDYEHVSAQAALA
ncbi:MAG: alanine dehydrogenase [Gammaproteobacteria bacterium]